MRYHLTAISGNAKTGPIPVSTTSAETCPPACPFNDGGCYAKSGPLALHWKKVSEDQRGDDFDTFIDKIKKLPKNQLFRHNQAGDLFGSGNRINSSQLQKFAIAAKRTNCFTYTHKPATKANVKAIRAANEHITINLSANNPAHADELLKHGLPVVTVLPINAGKKERTPEGKRIVTCPATTSDKVTCSSCALCAVKDRDYVIGFPAHGTSKKKANLIASTGE